MKIKLLIATGDTDYAEHLSNILVENHADVFEVSVCSNKESLPDLLSAQKFEIALLEAEIIENVNLRLLALPLLLLDDALADNGQFYSLKKVRKYQRISVIAGDILAYYAEISDGIPGINSKRAQITAVWSPAGGVGKTTIALAHATKKVSEGKQALYLNLEHFSSVPLCFAEGGKSISTVFEKMDGPVDILLRSIQQLDNGTGITYFRHPDNYDDMNMLTAEDIKALINAAALITDELIIDLPSICNENIRQAFALADKILLVIDVSHISRQKMELFVGQHNIFENIHNKAILVANKGASSGNFSCAAVVSAPQVQSADMITVFKSLSAINFEG